jgi:hypothetical protein
MSFQQKSTAAMLVIFLVAYGWYFARVLSAAGAGPVTDIAYETPLLVMIVALVVLGIIAHIVITVMNPGEGDATDERDRIIDLQAGRVGHVVLSIGALAGILLAMREAQPFWIAHALLAGLVLAEVVKDATKLVLYRRGL